MLVKATINRMPFGSKTLPDHEVEKEISLELVLNASQYSDLIEIDIEGGIEISTVINLVENHLLDNFTIGPLNIIRRETYNLSFDGKFDYKGEEFRSAKVKMVKDIGAVICLGLNIPYDQDFLVWCADNFRPDLVKIKIDLVKNAQATLPQPPKE